MPAIIVDRYGRRIEPDDGIVPDGGRVSVPFQFMDARSAHVARAFSDGVLHKPGYAESVMGDGFAATNSHERSQSAAEAARQDWINRISNQWRRVAADAAASVQAGSCALRCG